MTPETDSAGNNLNTKSSDLVDCELMSSLESEYDYEGEDDTASGQKFDFRLFHQVLEDIPIPRQKRYKKKIIAQLVIEIRFFHGCFLLDLKMARDPA